MQRTQRAFSIYQEPKEEKQAQSPVGIKQEPQDTAPSTVPIRAQTPADSLEIALIQQEIRIEQLRFRLLQAKAKDASQKRHSSVEALPDHLQPLSKKQKSKPQIGDEIVELSE